MLGILFGEKPRNYPIRDISKFQVVYSYGEVLREINIFPYSRKITYHSIEFTEPVKTVEHASRRVDINKIVKSIVIPVHMTQPDQTGSSILSICHTGDMWILGGYVDNQGALLEYENGSASDLSDLVPSMTYVIWGGAEPT